MRKQGEWEKGFGTDRVRILVKAARDALEVEYDDAADRQALRLKVKDCYAQWYRRTNTALDDEAYALRMYLFLAALSVLVMVVSGVTAAIAPTASGALYVPFSLAACGMFGAVTMFALTAKGHDLGEIRLMLASTPNKPRVGLVPPEAMIGVLEATLQAQHLVAGPATPRIDELVRLAQSLHRSAGQMLADTSIVTRGVPRKLLTTRHGRNLQIASHLRACASTIIAADSVVEVDEVLRQMREVLLAWARGELIAYAAKLSPARARPTATSMLIARVPALIVVAAGLVLWAMGRSAGMSVVVYGVLLVATVPAPLDTMRLIVPVPGASSAASR